LLVAGCLLLVTGYWLLDAGYWLGQNCHPGGSQDLMPRSIFQEIPASTGMTSVRNNQQPVTSNQQPFSFVTILPIMNQIVRKRPNLIGLKPISFSE
jgi:hypothetical protein